MDKTIIIKVNGSDLGYVKNAASKEFKRNKQPVTDFVAGTGDDAHLLSKVSDDPCYGYCQESPVEVGGGYRSGPENSNRYFDSLRGPEGQVIIYTRIKNCCSFRSENTLTGKGFLDLYRIYWQGSEVPVMLYLNMYKSGELLVPQGLTSK